MPRPATDVKGGGASMAASAKGPNHEKFMGRWKNFEAGFHGLSDFSQYISTLESSLDRENRLESELQDTKKQLSRFEEGRQLMVEAFANSHKDGKEKESRLVKDLRNAKVHIESLEAQLATLNSSSVSNDHFDQKIQEMKDENIRRVNEVEKDKATEVQRLLKVVSEAEKRLQKVESELSDKATLLIGTEVQLKRCRTYLKERKIETGVEELSAEFAPALEALSNKTHAFAKEYFFTTLPKDCNAVSGLSSVTVMELTIELEDDLFRQLQRSHSLREITRFIPISNTDTSKFLRMATAETFIAKQLTDTVLQPISMLEEATKDELEFLLNQLFEINPRQESILRSLILAAQRSNGRSQKARMLNIVVNNTRNILDPLLFDSTHSKGFSSGFEALLSEASDLWSQVQKCPDRILANTVGGDWGWDSYKEPEIAVALTEEQAALVPPNPEPLMTLFPRVYCTETSTTWHHGYALYSDQPVAIAGELESKEQFNRVNNRNDKMAGIAGKRRSAGYTPAGVPILQQRVHNLPESTRDQNLGKRLSPRKADGSHITPYVREDQKNRVI